MPNSIDFRLEKLVTPVNCPLFFEFYKIRDKLQEEYINLRSLLDPLLPNVGPGEDRGNEWNRDEKK